MKRTIVLSPNVRASLQPKILRYIGRLLLAMFRVNIAGIENLVRAHEISTGKLVVTANHISLLDGILIAFSSPIHMLYAVEPQYSLTNPFTSFGLAILARMGFGTVVPLDVSSRYGIRRLCAELERGNAVMIFPEGKIGTGEPQRAMRGVSWLLQRTGATEFKIQIQGAEKSRFFSKAGKSLWPVIQITYGC